MAKSITSYPWLYLLAAIQINGKAKFGFPKIDNCYLCGSNVLPTEITLARLWLGFAIHWRYKDFVFSPFNFIYFCYKAFIYLQHWRERVSVHDLMPIERLKPCVPDTHSHTRSLLSTTVCLRVQRYSSSFLRPPPSACCLRLFAFLQRNLSSSIGCNSLGQLLLSLFCFAIRMCVSWVQHAVSSKLR